MKTEYIHTCTLAVPESLIDSANHLACLLGESAGDINTFRNVTYTDGETAYAVAHTVVKSSFLDPTQTGTLPEDPAHAPAEYDRSLAESAFATVNTSGGILMAVDNDPHQQFEDWGLTPIETEEEEIDSAPNSLE